MNHLFLRFTLLYLCFLWIADEKFVHFAEMQRPNIIVMLANDLGYGDVQCYNSKSKIPTPQLNH